MGVAQQLTDVEGVPAGQLVDGLCVGPTPGIGEREHRAGRQGWEAHPSGSPLGGNGRKGAAQRTLLADVLVAVREQDEGGPTGESAGQVTKPVNGRLVGPVQVLDHDGGRAAARPEPLQRRGKEGVAVGARAELLEQPVALCRRDLEQRPEWARGEAPSHPPRSQRRSGRCAANASSSAVLPMPASPVTRTRRPCPRVASSAYSPKVWRKVARSSSSTLPSVRADSGGGTSICRRWSVGAEHGDRDRAAGLAAYLATPGSVARTTSFQTRSRSSPCSSRADARRRCRRAPAARSRRRPAGCGTSPGPAGCPSRCPTPGSPRARRSARTQVERGQPVRRPGVVSMTTGASLVPPMPRPFIRRYIHAPIRVDHEAIDMARVSRAAVAHGQGVRPLGVPAG